MTFAFPIAELETHPQEWPCVRSVLWPKVVQHSLSLNPSQFGLKIGNEVSDDVQEIID